MKDMTSISKDDTEQQNVLLTGTPIAEPSRRRVKAGDLEAEYDEGALRWISWKGVEVLRAIMFLVRTPGWGTPAANISGLTIQEDTEEFVIAYTAHYGETGTGVLVSTHIAGSSRGQLAAKATISAEQSFETNRSGFVVLHPLDGFAGTKVDVNHANAPAKAIQIPAPISPGQPLMDIQGIIHHPVEGLAVETRFEGDIFEMEDHRNWSDASFKTYSRPIGLPYPYLLSPDEPVEQAVYTTLRDDGISSKPASCVVSPVIEDQKMPIFALPLDSLAQASDALQQIQALKALASERILLRFDTSVEAENPDFSDLKKLLVETGSALELQTILVAKDDSMAHAEMASLKHALDELDINVVAVSAFPKVDEQSFQPGEERPPHPSEDAIASCLSEVFPTAKRLGGTPAFFTEFNRKRPNPSLWQGVCFATTPVVHAADDASVMETLQSLPHILNAATQLSSGLPLSVGPTGIGARVNPYGPGPSNNVPVDREGMAAQDPRQRGLFAAAWTVGYLAQIAAFAPERFAFGAATGPFGLVASKQSFARAFWDDLPDGSVYPLYHIARWINHASGCTIISARTESNIAHIAWRENDTRHALIANLLPQTLSLPDYDFADFGNSRVVVLEAGSVASLAAELKPDVSLAATDFQNISGYSVIYLRENLK